jgi:hypothetical protein
MGLALSVHIGCDLVAGDGFFSTTRPLGFLRRAFY